MPLAVEHVTASRIAPFLAKPAAVAELAAELGLGEESLLFIDDNPTECAAVRAALPAVAAWCWPQEQEEARLQLEHVWPLDLVGRAAATSADEARVASYAAEAPRRALRVQAGSLATYLEALELRISFEMASAPSSDPPLGAAIHNSSGHLNAPEIGENEASCHFREPERLAQLRERTNQFNSWRRPLPANGLAKLEGVAMRVADRFADYGLVGLVLCSVRDDKQLVLSAAPSPVNAAVNADSDGTAPDASPGADAAHPPRCACGCVPAGLSLLEAAAERQRRRKRAEAEAVTQAAEAKQGAAVVAAAAVSGDGGGVPGAECGVLSVHSFCMSCRVLGRGAEHAMLAQVGALAVSRGCAAVRVGLVASARNAPLVAFLERSAALLPYLQPPMEGIASESALVDDAPSAPLEGGSDGGGGGGGGGGSGGGGGGGGAAELVSGEEWVAARPQRWFYFAAEALRTFRYDPAAEEAAAQASEVTVPTDAPDVAAVSAGSTATAGSTSSQEVAVSPISRLELMAEAAGRIPRELRTVAQALALRGIHLPAGEIAVEDCAPVGRGTSAAAREALRGIWLQVLDLPVPEARGDTAEHDHTPFAALGGDSLAATRALGLAAAAGYPLPCDAVGLERLSLAQLAASFDAPPLTSSETPAVDVADTAASLPAALAPLRVGKYHGAAPSAPPATFVIRERDGRAPDSQLSDAGGISACAAGDVVRARALAAAGWVAAHAVDKFGSSALMWAASYGRVDAARWLVEEAGATVDAANKEGRSALMFGAKYGQLETCRYLLYEAGADPRLRMKNESTAFDWAVFGGHRPTMDLLADHPLVDVAALNRFGCAAVQWAAAAGSVESCRWLQARGISLTHVNRARHGAVQKAAWKGHDECLRWLLLAEDGPKLTAQIAMRDFDGVAVPEQVRANGQHRTADWLDELALRLGLWDTMPAETQASPA